MIRRILGLAICFMTALAHSDPPRLFVQSGNDLGLEQMHIDLATGSIWLGDRSGNLHRLNGTGHRMFSIGSNPANPNGELSSDASGKLIAVRDWSGSARLVAESQDALLPPRAAVMSRVAAIGASRDGSRVLFIGANGSVTLTDRSGLPIGRSISEATLGEALAAWVSPDGGRFLVIGRSILAGRLGAEGPTVEVRTPVPASLAMAKIAPSGRWIAVVDQARNLSIIPVAASGRAGASERLPHASQVATMAFNLKGDRLAWGEQAGRVGMVEPIRLSQAVTVQSHKARVTALRFASGERLLSCSTDGSAAVLATPSLAKVAKFEGQLGWVTAISETADPDRYVTVCSTDEIRFWSADKQAPIASVYLWSNGQWAVVSPDGRFDGSDGGRVSGLSWIISGQRVGLDQFSATYYSPGLLRSMLGLDQEAKGDVPLPDVAPLPTATIERAGTRLKVAVRNNGGGVGRVEIFVRGVRVREIRPADVEAAQQLIDIDLEAPEIRDRLPGIPLDRVAESITILATARDELIRARLSGSAGIEDVVPTVAPKFFALVVGCDYPGTGYELAYPSADCRSIAAALESTAKALPFAQVDVQLIWLSKSGSSAARPTKRAILDAIGAMKAKVGAGDVFVLYLSGHGAARAGGKPGYYYLTSEAPRVRTTIESDPLAPSYTISGDELAEALANSVYADKRLVILDTCAAGAAEQRLARDVDVETAQEIRRFHERSGSYLLAGAAENALSFESPALEHGLMTYALLEAIQAIDPAATREGSDRRRYLDVERWLAFAEDRVPALMRMIGSGDAQQPRKTNGARAQSFGLGVIDQQVAKSIGLRQPKPTVAWGFIGDEADEDSLDLEAQLQGLTTTGSRGAGIGVAARGARGPSLLQVNVRYRKVGVMIEATLILQRFVGPTLRPSTVRRWTVSESPDRIAATIYDSVVKNASQVWEIRG